MTVFGSKFNVRFTTLIRTSALTVLLCSAGFANTKSVRTQHDPQHSDSFLSTEVYHQLVLVPWLSIFDNLQYRVQNNEVTLMGQVVNPATKADAETHVKGIEGVMKVINNIEVLPNLPMDEAIRRAEYHAIYGDPALERYAMGSLPPIHIIVKGGHVTLEGVVANEMDKDLAGTRAKGVPGTFSITNNLQVESTSTRK